MEQGQPNSRKVKGQPASSIFELTHQTDEVLPPHPPIVECISIGYLDLDQSRLPRLNELGTESSDRSLSFGSGGRLERSIRRVEVS